MMEKFFILGIICGLVTTSHSVGYLGKKIADLTQLHHGVSGEVYAVDARTLLLKNFNYDGEGPAAYFYVGNTQRPSNEGAIRLRDERGSTEVLRRYRNKHITLSLPEGKTLRDIRWFSVWCDDFAVNFGDVTIPKTLDFPRPQKITGLSGVHDVSSDNIVIVDAQSLLVPNFSYDGEAPDAKFWVGPGPKPSPNGLRIPDENGKETPLRRYEKKTIVLTLPGELTVFDIGHFGVWCEAFTVDFGHIRLPKDLNVPPSLRMLGISPQSKLNCEVLYDDLAFEVRWAVAGESVVVQLVAKLENDEYMSFGLSPDLKHSVMVNGDVVVAWVDTATGKGYAHDYFLDAKSQCSGVHGSCPDTRIQANSDSVRLLNAAMVNGYSIVTYQRPLSATDKLDLPIYVNRSQAIIWGIGPLNARKEVSFHSHYTKGDRLIDFGRQPAWNCPMPDGDSNKQSGAGDDVAAPVKKGPQQVPSALMQPNDKHRGGVQYQTNNRRDESNAAGMDMSHHSEVPPPKPAPRQGAWEIPPIQCYEPEDGVFYAQMGPTGGKHGYPAITGHVGWGISWYINGLLIPEINVVRGKTYTFVVEGGHDPETPAKYHPFYITDDPVGGYEYKTPQEKEQVQIYAGVHRSRNGQITPIGIGRICNWTPDINGPLADEYSSFGAYQRSLMLKCDEGEPGIITWTPDDNTPDTVYYQCFTHRHLGWKINVLDDCDDAAKASEIDEVFVDPDSEDGLVPEPSIRHETKLKPSDNFLLQHEKNLIKNHNMNGSPPKLSFEYQKNKEITKLINDGIRAAEALEDSIVPKQNISSLPYASMAEYKVREQIDPETVRPQQQQQQHQLQHHQQQQQKQLPKKQQQQQQDEHQNLPQRDQDLSTGEISSYMQPPQSNGGPVFRITKLPVRRPPPLKMNIERRPLLNRPHRPHILPQPSMIVNHYKKPVSPLLRPFLKQNKPIKSFASVLLLGQPTDIPEHKPSGGEHSQKSQQKQNQQQQQRMPINHDTSSGYTNLKKRVEKPRRPSYPIPIKSAQPKDSPPVFYDKPTKIAFNHPYEVTESNPHNSNPQMLPAINTGFSPDSVVVEGGFRPIVKRRDDVGIDDDSDDDMGEMDNANRRRDKNIADMEEMGEGGTGDAALYVNTAADTQSKANFEPMFIPSPPDSIHLGEHMGKIVKKEQLSGDLGDMEVEDGEDKMAIAAERIDAYYLPPDNRKKPMKVFPEGTVVSYDGTPVLDTTLVMPQSKSDVAQRVAGAPARSGISKTEQLVRNTPQFRPFRGEVPPPVPDFLPPSVASHIGAQSNGHKPQTPVTEYSNPLTSNTSPISTKLTLLKVSNDETMVEAPKDHSTRV